MAVEYPSLCSGPSRPSPSGGRYAQLDYDERRAIDRMRQRRVSVAEIAARLGRHRSTIYRELSRNRFVDNEWPDLGGYYAHVANDAARKRRERLAKLVRIPSLADAVIERLEIGWSPEQIAGRLRLGGSGVRVCHETIYRFVYGKHGQARDLFRFLPEHRRRRRPRRARRRHERFAPDALAIRHRPAEIAAREEFGHWEGDLVLFRKEHGRANLTTLVERTTRFAVLMRNNDRTSKPVMNQIIDGLGTLPRHARRSFTFDRETEPEVRAQQRVRSLARAERRPAEPDLVLRSPVPVAEGSGREHQPAHSPLLATLDRSALNHARNARRRDEANERHAAQVPRLPDTRRGVPDRRQQRGNRWLITAIRAMSHFG